MAFVGTLYVTLINCTMNLNNISFNPTPETKNIAVTGCPPDVSDLVDTPKRLYSGASYLLA